MRLTVNKELSKKLDQFYTDPAYAESFYKTIQSKTDFDGVDLFLEPSAGTGNFFNLMDEKLRVGIDLDPKCNGVICQDFLTWQAPANKKIYTIGNPPFGKNSGLAVQFFNHAASFSECVAFIVPRTFRKASIINRLNKNFHLIYDEVVPDNSFIYNDKPYNVWCCAQIWVKSDRKREPIKIYKLDQFKEFFEIVDPSKADFAIQRVGGRAGLIRIDNFVNYSPESHYFIKQHKSYVLDIFQNINFETVKYNTAGNPSVSPGEMLNLWIESANRLGYDCRLTHTRNDAIV